MITRLPNSTSSLLTAAANFPTFETAVSTLLQTLHKTSTSTCITIHPAALRFSLTLSCATPPPLDTLRPLSALCSLEYVTPFSTTLLRRGHVLQNGPGGLDGRVVVEVWELFCATPVRRRVEMARDERDVIAKVRQDVVRIALSYPGRTLSLAAGACVYEFPGCLNRDSLQVAFGLPVEWVRVFEQGREGAVQGFIAREGLATARYQICARAGVQDARFCDVVKEIWRGMPREGRKRCAAFVIHVSGGCNGATVKSAVMKALGLGVERKKQGSIDFPRVKSCVAVGKRARFADVLVRPVPKRPKSEGRVSTRVREAVRKRPASAVEDAYKRMVPSWRNPCLPCRGKLAPQQIYDKRSVCMTKERIGKVRVVGQVENKFIVVADEDGIYAVDQHAASERYLYEKLLKRCVTERRKHKLANPCLVNVPHELTVLAERVVLEAEKWGWGIIDGNVVTHVPKFEAIDVILQPEALVEWFEDCDSGGKQVPTPVARIVASAACHAAVRFGDRLTREMCSSIVTSLAECDMPFVCAHGRPNVVPIVVFEHC